MSSKTERFDKDANVTMLAAAKSNGEPYVASHLTRYEINDIFRRAIARAMHEVDISNKARIELLEQALKIIAGRQQCLDNLISNVEIAITALDFKPTTKSLYKDY